VQRDVDDSGDIRQLLPPNCDPSKETAEKLNMLMPEVRRDILTWAVMSFGLAALFAFGVYWGVGTLIVLSHEFGAYRSNLISAVEVLFGMSLSSVHHAIGNALYYIFAPLMLIVGVIMTVACLCSGVRRLLSLLRTPTCGGISPNDAARAFFVDACAISDKYKAWGCLLESAKSDFAAAGRSRLVEFQAMWRRHVSKKLGEKDRALQVGDSVTLAESDNVAIVRTRIWGSAPHEEIRAIVRICNRWYLADGKCYDDVPPPFQRFVGRCAERN
jgi:hypothetical protein